MEYFTRINKAGYAEILVDDKWVKEHRKNMEDKIGRKLNPIEQVHHIDFCKVNNDISNLMLFPNSKEHTKFHRKIQQFGMTRPVQRMIRERFKEFENKK